MSLCLPNFEFVWSWNSPMCVRETVWAIFHRNENRLVYALCLCRPARARHFPIFSAPNKLTNGLTVRGLFFLWESFSQNYRSVNISIITVWSIFPLLLNIKLIVTMTWQAEMIKKKLFFLQISRLRRDKRLQDILAAQICSTEQKRAAWRQKGIWGLASWLGQSKRGRSSRIRWWWWWCRPK